MMPYQIQNACDNKNTETKNGGMNTKGDNSDEGEFFDACEELEISKTTEMDLDRSLEEAKLAICLFFNNKFDEARSIMEPHKATSMYHAMGHAVFSFLEAILTFEHQHITKAAEQLKKCLELCQSHRHKTSLPESIGNKFKRHHYTNLTEMESHAQLCAAETLLLKALLTFIEDETLSSLIRGSLQIRNCYQNYKECAQILAQRTWQSKVSKDHFESGVRMGLGTFNLMISLLPACIVKVLEFIGFSGNKEVGLKDLNAGFELEGLRQVLCALTLLGYHLIVCYVLGYQEGDMQLCQNILEKQLTQFPNSVWFLFFKGRFEFMQGNLSEANYWYLKSLKSQQVWPQFHHLSFWELLWVNCLKLDWREASLYATYLAERSKWSRTIYTYQRAAVMLMLKDATKVEQHTIDKLMHEAPGYKQRIAGKSLPMEKFVLRRTARYFEQNRSLCLPAIELMYLWNTFKVFKKNYQAADNILQEIEKEMQQLSTWKGTADLYLHDNRALCLLLRAACYRYMQKPGLAMQDLNDCLQLQNAAKDPDRYVFAYASVEVALLYADKGQFAQAIVQLEDTKKKFSGFSLESRLHFRIHAALMDFKKI